MKPEFPAPENSDGMRFADGARADLSNPNIREDLANAGRCALVHLPTGRTCLLPLRHPGPCEFHKPQDTEAVVSGGD